MVYSHVLEQAYRADPSLFKNKTELFKTASNITDISMVDYRPHERAAFFNKTGLFGEMFSALQTYKVNQYSQLWAFGKKKAYDSMATMMAMQAIVGGMMGFYLMDEVDALIGLINSVSSKRVPTTRELILKDAPDYLAFGGVSAMTGLDFSSKFSAANVVPDSLPGFVSPYFEAAGKMAEGAVSLAKNPTLPQAASMMAQSGPAIGRAAAEQYLTDDKGNVLDTKTMSGAKVRRAEGEQAARWTGLRSTREARELGLDRARDRESQWYNEKRSGVLNKVNQAIAKDPSKLPELMRSYVVDYEGEPVQFMLHINKTGMAQQIPASVRRELQSIKKPRKYIREY
jgi:hypothetical protein